MAAEWVNQKAFLSGSRLHLLRFDLPALRKAADGSSAGLLLFLFLGREHVRELFGGKTIHARVGEEVPF
jgi:hypothetical protein